MTMALGDRFYRQASEKVSDRVGEPVELITRAGRPGAMAAVIAGQVARGIDVAGGNPNGLGAAIPKGRMVAAGGTEGSKLPMSFLVALTPNALRVFTVTQSMFGVKVKKELGALPREGLRLATADAGIATQFQLEGADGSAIAFEMNRCKFTTKFGDDLRAALPQSSSGGGGI
jgi:hypothetical protein